MPKKNTPETAGAQIALGPWSIPSADLPTLAAESYAKNGVVLVNERVKFTVVQDGIPVGYTASLYVSREAVNDDEAAKVAKVADERKAASKAREDEETERLAREKRAAFELGQSSTMTALRNVGDLVASAQALNRLAPTGR